MVDDATDLSRLTAQWRQMSMGDRKAILRKLPADQRQEFLSIANRPARDGQEQSETDRPYQAYSPWLGRLLETISNNPEDAAQLTPTVRQALLAGHEHACKTANRQKELSPLSTALTLVRKWGDRLWGE